MEIEICSPDGLKASEVKTITAIGNSFRDTWRGYASFLVNDGQGSMEIDLLLIRHDRFNLCDITDWVGEKIQMDGTGRRHSKMEKQGHLPVLYM